MNINLKLTEKHIAQYSEQFTEVCYEYELKMRDI